METNERFEKRVNLLEDLLYEWLTSCPTPHGHMFHQLEGKTFSDIEIINLLKFSVLRRKRKLDDQ